MLARQPHWGAMQGVCQDVQYGKARPNPFSSQPSTLSYAGFELPDNYSAPRMGQIKPSTGSTATAEATEDVDAAAAADSEGKEGTSSSDAVLSS